MPYCAVLGFEKQKLRTLGHWIGTSLLIPPVVFAIDLSEK
jgi:hypothetical protein